MCAFVQHRSPLSACQSETLRKKLCGCEPDAQLLSRKSASCASWMPLVENASLRATMFFSGERIRIVGYFGIMIGSPCAINCEGFSMIRVWNYVGV